MKLTMATLLLAFSLPLAAGEEGSWGGLLADAICKQQSPQASCPVDASTMAFGVELPDGRFLPFDEAGNEKAAAELEGVTDKSSPRVMVEGDSDGTMITVRTIEFR